MINFEWFENVLASHLQEFEVKYRFFAKGDFGSLNQVEFNSQRNGGEIDFWSSGRISMHFVDYEKGEELLNILIMPGQEKEKEEAFNRLLQILMPNS